MEITISNTSYFDKTQDEWIDNENYKASSWDNYGFTEGLGLNLFKNKLNMVSFKDEPLSNEECISLKHLLENKIKELLIGRIPEKYGRPTIYFLGEEIKLNIVGKNDQDNIISNLYSAYKICEECLQENKPVYLSITEENN
jgi:hypothetical protein